MRCFRIDCSACRGAAYKKLGRFAKFASFIASAKIAMTFFSVQFVNYANLCWNYRAIAQAQYIHIAITDGIASYIGFKLVKKIGEAESRAALVGYILGGMVGSLISTFVSKKVFGA